MALNLHNIRSTASSGGTTPSAVVVELVDEIQRLQGLLNPSPRSTWAARQPEPRTCSTCRKPPPTRTGCGLAHCDFPQQAEALRRPDR